MIAVEIRDLVVESERYPIVKGLNLTVEEGEQVGILGDLNDAVSLLKVFSGVTLPTSGEIWIYNMPPRQALQRGLIFYTTQSNLTQMTPTTILLTSSLNPTTSQNLNTVIHPLIEISNESIQKNYKYNRMIRLVKRKEVLSCE
ncbi:MAG: hypothetical protein ACUVTP_12595 [Candidatus Fervidibacter sp.]|uniref:hypothetical protein n=1 Tax=Candidatus Fervidibacter sp. TaxID=3100871 RepID=UPI00404ACA54